MKVNQEEGKEVNVMWNLANDYQLSRYWGLIKKYKQRNNNQHTHTIISIRYPKNQDACK